MLAEPMNDPIYDALKKQRANLAVELEFATVGRDRAASLRDSAVAALAAADDMLVAYKIAWRDVKEAAEAAEAAGGPHPPATWPDCTEDRERRYRVIRASRALDAAAAARKAAADEMCAALDATGAAVADAPKVRP